MNQAIAFIVPTYNRAGMLPGCLDSIRSQMGPSDEILVVDDGSSDNTLAVLAHYAARHRCSMHIDRLPNGGKSKALNHALRVSDASLVWIVDDDDVLLPDARRILTELMADNPDCGFAYGRHERFFGDADLPACEAPRFGTGYWTNVGPEDFLIANLEDMFAHQPGMLVRRSLYDRVGPFDETLPRSVDYEMLIRLAEHGRAAGTEEVVFLQRQHSGPRGPAASRIDAKLRDANWAEHDTEIFAQLRTRLPLRYYLPSRRIKNGYDMRRALVQRGTIMARKGLWTHAIEDFHAALGHQGGALNAGEKAVVRRAFGSKYAGGSLQDAPEIFRGLASLARASPVGAELARTLVRGFYWHLREPGARLGRIPVAARLTLAAWGWTRGGGRMAKNADMIAPHPG